MILNPLALVLLLAICCSLHHVAAAKARTLKGKREQGKKGDKGNNPKKLKSITVQLGPRPYYLVDQLEDGPFKRKLQSCSEGPFYPTRFTIAHRGGGILQFPEHSVQSHRAGHRMGAGIFECDVTFTSDGALVCLHDQCDLHIATNIVATNLASKCTIPFTPAQFDATGTRTKEATALCCTSDLTLVEFKSLQAKMVGFNPNAITAQEYLGGTDNWRTDLYNTGATLLTHREYIALIQSFGGGFTPELKEANPAAKLKLEAVFGSRNAYVQAIINEYKAAGVKPHDVWAQSFNISDIYYLIQNEPAFGRQAVYLDPASVVSELPTVAQLQQLYNNGVRIWAPPMWALVTTDSNNGSSSIVASSIAKAAKAIGFQIITWSIERSGRIQQEVLPTRGTSSPSYYYQTTLDALKNDGDILTTLHVLAQDVGILGIFTDWGATVTYYANCYNLFP